MGLLNSLSYKYRLWRLTRDEFESQSLRDWFRTEFDTEVGLYSYGCFDRWRFPPPIRIGRYCSFAKSVRVVEANHPLDALTTHPFLYDPRFGVTDRAPHPAPPLVVEDDVWVSHNVTILPGCRFIGRGAVIAAGAVVTKDVPRYAIATGMPAKVQRLRFAPDLIDAIEASRWWELDRRKLAELARRDPDILFHPSVERLATLRKAENR